jgi:hypothetical protein
VPFDVFVEHESNNNNKHSSSIASSDVGMPDVQVSSVDSPDAGTCWQERLFLCWIVRSNAI